MNVNVLEEKCLKKGYSISRPCGGKDNDVAFVAYQQEQQYRAIMFMNHINKDIGEWERYYRDSYPHIKYYRRLIK
jgi:hypothetical protein